MICTRVLQLLALSAGLTLAGPAFGAEFMPLPQLPGSTQAGDAFAVSADGSAIVGTSHDGTVLHAVKWTMSGGVQILGAGNFSFAQDVSADGKRIVGYALPSGGPEAFRWSEGSGSMVIGDLPGRENSTGAYGVSSDGLVIVGSSSSSLGGEAFRWAQGTGIVGLGDLSGGIVGARAYASSMNGSVIVGSAVSEKGIEAFQWKSDSGMVGLGDLPGGGFFSEAYDVSQDGTVVVGRSSASSDRVDPRAFRWSAATGMIEIPAGGAELGPTRIAEAVSGDGNVIVGSAYGPDGAFAWDGFHGTRSIAKLLESQGVDVLGWDLGIARGVSFDGTTIAGLGINPVGKNSHG